MRRLLVVDGEPQMLRALDVNLTARQYAVATAHDGTSALWLASRTPPDAVIVSLELPDIEGVDVITGLRAGTPMPIIALSERTDPAHMVEALDAGADDCLTKPISMDELAARLRAVFRRSDQYQPRTADVGDYTVDLSGYTVVPRSGHGAPVHLTPTEWRLLVTLLRHPDRLVTGHQLLRDIWGPDHDQNTNYLRIHMSALRHKLEPDPSHPRYLITEPGLGYRFQPEGRAA
ncbi:response regulator transcription factor [Streptantibioticus ferralitis]|uniref:Response regulator transcription factor n=1 Tax=Streptantibioticus ferralitis TaxID=236510 RepID=A0ABT5YTW8_9ACTN|nr:response regulator transcription factor [Streptantibioticus ferralitis]MDF2255056.1 response regulator transcription factor [Streptantibioticus ferralitis]